MTFTKIRARGDTHFSDFSIFIKVPRRNKTPSLGSLIFLKLRSKISKRASKNLRSRRKFLARALRRPGRALRFLGRAGFFIFGPKNFQNFFEKFVGDQKIVENVDKIFLIFLARNFGDRVYGPRKRVNDDFGANDLGYFVISNGPQKIVKWAERVKDGLHGPT